MQFFQYQTRAEVPLGEAAAETVTVDRWQPTFSPPIRRAFTAALLVAGAAVGPLLPPEVAAAVGGPDSFGWQVTASPLFQYQACAETLLPIVAVEPVTIDGWAPTFTQPRSVPPRLRGHTVVVVSTDPEATTLDRWQPTYSGPILPRLNRPEGRSTGSLQPTAQEQWQPTYPGPIPARQNRPEGYLVGSPFPVAPPPSFDWYVVQPQPRPTTPRLLTRQAGCSASVLTTDPGVSGLVYDLFVGDDLGGPIDYTTPVVTTTSLAADLPPLSLGARKRIGVRARNLLIGWDDGNTDAWVEIVLDAAGNDVTARPFPPGHLSAAAVAGGSVVLYWSYPWLDATVLATGFHVYQGTSGIVSYASPVATILNGPPVVPGNLWFKATVSGLVDGTIYVFSVRAYNAVAEEDNTIAVSATAVSTAPGAVTSLGGMVSS